MSVTTSHDRHDDYDLQNVSAREHPNCVVCSQDNPQGLGVRFEVLADGSVQGDFACQGAYEGYPGIIHGGVLSALLDGAMLHCLFAIGCRAVTVDLSIQFRHPVKVRTPATVRARLLGRSDSLFTLAGEIIQGDHVKTRATGRFLARPGPDGRQSGRDGHDHDHDSD
jgi:acyl-coenzyme A thioesterase PaaI-like protein